LLNVNKIVTGYGEARVLFGVSMKVRERSITALLGSNGAGKSTTLKTIMGLLPAWQGRIEFKGVDVTNEPTHRRVELGMALVPEGRRLWPQISVEDHLRLAAYTPRARDRLEESLEIVYSLFPRLKERRKQLAGTMSGGEQQMLAIARALMTAPQLLMLDEPSLGLAPKLVIEVLDAIRSLRDEYAMTILLVEQNVHMALEVADYGYVIEHGRIVAEDTPEKLEANPLLRRAYLGI